MENIMKKFKDFYREWINKTPEPHSRMGGFGEGVWSDMFYEGLITSYPREAVEKILSNTSPKDKIELVKSDTGYIKAYITPIDNDISSIKNIVNGKLRVYGYKVGKVNDIDEYGKYLFLIEPIFSKKVNTKNHIEMFHLTHGKHLEKIAKIGLTPRDTTTVFAHPGNRIYLFSINNKADVEQLKLSLVSAKRYNDTDLPEQLKYSVENMVLLKVKLPEKADLHYDPMFGGWENFKGYYTTINIPPENIEFVE